VVGMPVRRIGRVLALVAVAAASAAVASAAGTAPAARSNRALAQTLAGTLLGKVHLPHEAVQVRTSPEDPSTGSWLSGPGSRPGSPLLAQRHLFWRLPGDPQSAIGWIEAHPPAGLSRDGTGTAGRYGVTQEWDVMFAARPVTGRISQAGLVVAATAATGGGTAMRVDSFAVWMTPRPASEVIPGGVRSVLVSVDHWGGSAFKQALVTVPDKVARLVSFVDSRQITQPGWHSCPPIGAETRVLDLRFLGPAGTGAVPLARAVEEACGDLTFYIRGHRQHPLQEDASLAVLLRRLGVRPVRIR
jgi:hypothetical protein